MIQITRNLARKAAICGIVGLGLLAGLAAPSVANYQSGVDAYYRGEFQAAINAWRPLAEAGDPVAQNSLGALFDHGLGVPEDNYEAARWYEMAAEQGLPLAMRNLANQYATGHGKPYDVDMARQWYERAAGLGDKQSASLLRQLRPTAPTAAASAAPTFATPTTTGSLAEPVPGAASAAPAASTAQAGSTDDLAITADGNAAAAPQPAAPGQEILLDIGGQTIALSGSDTGAANEPAPIATPIATPEPAASAAATPMEPVQEAAVAMPPARRDGNWLLGQWQGPSLGCPKEGGIEFTEAESLSWFDGEVAVRMRANYEIEGTLIRVTSLASDGSAQTYAYRQESGDRMVIAAVPESMPQSMIGIAYRRCGTAPAQAASPQTASVIEVPAGGEIPAQTPAPALQEAAQLPDAEGSAQPAAVAPAGATAADGWAAFERGDAQMSLAIFTGLAETGDTDMQLLVGQIHDFGQGVPQNDAEALKWYLRAAEAGNAKAQYQAGLLYFRSPNVPQNLVESYRWLSLAAEAGGASAIPAKSMLNDLDRQMPEEDLAKARQLLKPAN